MGYLCSFFFCGISCSQQVLKDVFELSTPGAEKPAVFLFTSPVQALTILF
jgi:hypothetical protein